MRKKLGEQRRFLENSAALFDQGDSVEAIRMAGVMRTLLGKGELVSMLGMKRTLLNTSVPVLPSRPEYFVGLVTLVLERDGTSREILPQCNSNAAAPCVMLSNVFCDWSGTRLVDDAKRKLRIEKWCAERVFIFSPSRTFSRWDLLIAAANKDGSAHVDRHLDPDYESLQNGSGFAYPIPSSATLGWNATIKGFSGSFHITRDGLASFRDLHFPALRQMAHELLTSKDLWTTSL